MSQVSQETLNGMMAGGFIGLGIGIILTVAMFLAITLYAINVVATWFIFNKAGEKGWKSIIPFYNAYTLYGIVWKKSIFWVVCILAFVSGIMSGIAKSFTATDPANTVGMVFSIIQLVISIILVVILIKTDIKTAKAFGKGVGFTLGLIFFPTIFNAILGFGKSEYVLNKGTAIEE